MIELLRVGSHRTIVEGAERFKTATDGTLAVWWKDGTSAVYPADQWCVINARKNHDRRVIRKKRAV